MKIRTLRRANNLTQFELAEKVGVHRTAVTMWETGKSFPTTKTLIELARVFEVPLDELIKADKDGSDK
ncbi:hypothetical protein SDC9_138273 [bioreactor metagenome]|uniref:HTH cro/C1-type domain-containing protein n=1 Tax=bioreactor metagenome TaxID=1076179 RepID=A0A645DPB0_9ZZZZ